MPTTSSASAAGTFSASVATAIRTSVTRPSLRVRVRSIAALAGSKPKCRSATPPGDSIRQAVWRTIQTSDISSSAPPISGLRPRPSRCSA